MDMAIVCWLKIAILLSTLGISQGSTRCLTCTYIFAGTDGSAGIECVTDVYNFTQHSTADCVSDMCMIRTVYEQYYKRLLSLTRGCGTENITNCDEPGAIRPTCTKTCITPECNNQDGNLWKEFEFSNRSLAVKTQTTLAVSFVSLFTLLHLLPIQILDF